MSKYVNIIELRSKLTEKTKVWQVVSKDGPEDSPGIIKWHEPWGKYVLLSENALYDCDALRMIADFCEFQTKEHDINY